jgi:hypothetical protein
MIKWLGKMLATQKENIKYEGDHIFIMEVMHIFES